MSFNTRPPFTEEDIKAIIESMGDDHTLGPYDFDEDGDIWTDDTMDKYADFIQNYVYTYKPEATEIDPSIDPEEEHIGPMAQDIEKVNPACIKETPKGVKEVDTGRLAMMNAGVLADVIRRLEALETGGKLNGNRE